jgi:hypothetical protein
MNDRLPRFTLDLVGRVFHGPEDFDPASPIGQAHRTMLAAQQALGEADAAVQSAEAETRRLTDFIAHATMKTSPESFGQARDRVELIGRAMPSLQADLRAAALANDQASARFNGQGNYAGYSAAVSSWNSLIVGGLSYGDNPTWYVSQWQAELKRLPAILDEFELQLTGFFHVEEHTPDE